MTPAPEGRSPRGSFLLFWLSFGLVVAAGGALAFAAGTFFETVAPLQISAVLSAIGIGAAVAALVVRRR